MVLQAEQYEKSQKPLLLLVKDKNQTSLAFVRGDWFRLTKWKRNSIAERIVALILLHDLKTDSKLLDAKFIILSSNNGFLLTY